MTVNTHIFFLGLISFFAWSVLILEFYVLSEAIEHRVEGYTLRLVQLLTTYPNWIWSSEKNCSSKQQVESWNKLISFTVRTRNNKISKWLDRRTIYNQIHCWKLQCIYFSITIISYLKYLILCSPSHLAWWATNNNQHVHIWTDQEKNWSSYSTASS